MTPAEHLIPAAPPGPPQPVRSSLRAALAMTVLALLAPPSASMSIAQEGDPFRGRDLFAQKGCSRCHSVWGHGGSLGPDIVVVVQGKTWYELVGDFWNHTPRMMEEVSQQGYEWPLLDSHEMADTLSYLYYLRLFDRPGDPARGAETYARLQCAECHTLGHRGGDGGGPLDLFGAYPSPTPLAQAMWNAGPRMQVEQVGRGRTIPQFVGSEMADLQAHIRADGLRPDRDVKLQPLPDPVRGAVVFNKKRCGSCHGTDRDQAPDVSMAALSRTVAEITGMLWNHSYAMSSDMEANNIPFPRFEGTELSDLIAHLYFLGFVGAPGDPDMGARIFAEKGCADCHQDGVEGVPDVARMGADIDRVGLAAAMWNHAPRMHQLMAEKLPYWPKFETGEMRHLAAYLGSKPEQPLGGGASP